MEKILSYLRDTYNPVGMIVYGSFADGSNHAHSDFDALVITRTGERRHDDTVLDGTELDVFVYPTETFTQPYDCADFVQVWDGKIVLDADGSAAKLKAAVAAYLDALPAKSAEENHRNVAWCEKMLRRAGRGDAEGYFRWHWLLTDSLEIYCDLRGMRYFGPKKTIRVMQAQDAGGAALYEAALRAMDYDALAAWVAYLNELL